MSALEIEEFIQDKLDELEESDKIAYYNGMAVEWCWPVIMDQDYLFDLIESSSGQEVFDWFGGAFNKCADYFMFDGYGHLTSLNSFEAVKLFDDNLQDFLEDPRGELVDFISDLELDYQTYLEEYAESCRDDSYDLAWRSERNGD